MKHLKLFFALFAMLALGVGNAWAAEATITFSEKGLENGVQYLDPFEIDANTTIVFAGGANDGKYYNTGSGIRIYADGSMTIACTNGTISEISFTFSGSSYKPTSDVANPTGYSTSTNKWTGSASSVTLTRPSGSGHWRLQKVTVTYTPSSGGETPDPEPDPTPDPEEPETPGTGGTGTINFNSNAVKINAASVTGKDNLNNTWTITTVGTTSYTANNAYYQVGSGSKPATSITFTTTLPSDVNVTAFSAKFGGFNGTAGAVTLKVDDTSVGTGSLNGTSDVVVENSSEATGKTLTVTVTGIAKGVKVYYISYTYTTASSGDEPETPKTDLTDAQFAWSAATAEATMGAANTFPTLTNTLVLTVAYDSSNKDAATIAADGTITLVAPGTTTISAKFAGGEVSGTTYAAKTVTYALTVLKAPATPTDNVYIKVTSNEGLTNGEYLIVYEDASNTTPAPVAFNGALATKKLDVASNNIVVSIASNTIAGNTDIDAATFTINTAAGTIQTKDGYYIGQTSNANGLATSTTTEYTNTISIENDGSATITSGGAYLRYNSDANQWRFRYYKSGSYSSQKAITLYKKTNGQQLAGLAYATTKYLTKLGDAFATPALTNLNSLAVTYSSSDNNVATVAADGAITIKAAGVVKITASFAGNSSFLEGSASYTIGVTEHAGTQADPYSVADARRVIDVMGTAEGVYATGIVSEIVTAYNSEYGNITYNISIDGTTVADQLQAYRGKGVNGEKFSSANDIKVGDEVVIKGNLKLHNGTLYEFDADNQLVSLKRDKQQAGLAYEEKEHTANVGEDFTEPTLTNPNSLTVTYSSSNTALATVDATTGEVSILAAGKVTITASSAADATYAAGSASYNITITDPSLAVATLPFYFNGKQADIEGTPGMTQSGIDSKDYADAPYLKFNTAGDWAIVQFDSEPGAFSFLLKQNGDNAGTFTVYESANGEGYTSVWSGGSLGGNGKSSTIEPTLAANTRFVKFEYTTKGASTNYGLGEISIKKADHRQDAGLAWSPATVSLTVGDAFTPPTFSNPNSLEVSFESSNTELATVNAGVISLVSGKTGTATITAKYAGDATYKATEVTCVITVSPKSEKVVILAQYNGQWYALQAAYFSTYNNRLAAIPVNYVGGKLYNVEEADKATIEWQLAISGTKATFKNGENYLTGANGTDLKLGTATFEWDYNGELFLTDGDSRTFIYHKDGYFRNYATSNAIPNSTTYSDKPVVTAPVYDTAIEIGSGDNSTVIAENQGQRVNVIVDRAFEEGDEWYTLCVPFNMPASLIGTAYQLSGLIQKDAEYVEVNLAAKTTIEAGKPYLVQPNVTVNKFVVENVTILNTTGESIAKSIEGLSVTMQGVINGGGTTEDLYWVGNGGFLYNDPVSKLGLRTYFNITTPSGIAPRMRVVAGENVETGVEDIITTDAPVKVIENGQLIIIRDGVKYNVQGQVIK